MLRIKINSIQVQETVEENDQVREAVQRDRKYQIDAAIVRIMKTRRSLSHSQLLAEIYTQVRKITISWCLCSEFFFKDQISCQAGRY